MYCSSNNQVKSSMLLGQRRRWPVCYLMLKVDILGRQDHRESLSAVDGAPFDVAGLPAQFRQVWRCHVV